MYFYNAVGEGGGEGKEEEEDDDGQRRQKQQRGEGREEEDDEGEDRQRQQRGEGREEEEDEGQGREREDGEEDQTGRGKYAQQGHGPGDTGFPMEEDESKPVVELLEQLQDVTSSSPDGVEKLIKVHAQMTKSHEEAQEKYRQRIIEVM